MSTKEVKAIRSYPPRNSRFRVIRASIPQFLSLFLSLSLSRCTPFVSLSFLSLRCSRMDDAKMLCWGGFSMKGTLDSLSFFFSQSAISDWNRHDTAAYIFNIHEIVYLRPLSTRCSVELRASIWLISTCNSIEALVWPRKTIFLLLWTIISFFFFYIRNIDLILDEFLFIQVSPWWKFDFHQISSLLQSDWVIIRMSSLFAKHYRTFFLIILKFSYCVVVHLSAV